jgi:hypothetical protein
LASAGFWSWYLYFSHSSDFGQLRPQGRNAVPTPPKFTDVSEEHSLKDQGENKPSNNLARSRRRAEYIFLLEIFILLLISTGCSLLTSILPVFFFCIA